MPVEIAQEENQLNDITVKASHDPRWILSGSFRSAMEPRHKGRSEARPVDDALGEKAGSELALLFCIFQTLIYSPHRMS